MKTQLTILLFFVANYGFAQLNGKIINSENNEPIPYVNIWIENEPIGTTSTINGKFQLDFEGVKTIVFSAIGFETLKISTNRIPKTIKMSPKITNLEEIVVTPQKRSEKLVIGKFRRSKINNYFACGTKPWIVARYFPFQKAYEKTPFLQKIRILTDSDVKNAKFNIRLYNIGSNGQPSTYLYDKNIIGIAKKGKRITEINLADLDIQFPENGFFIALEWLIIEKNKYEYWYTKSGSKSKKKYKGIYYEPSFGTYPYKQTAEKSWQFMNGNWDKYSTKFESQRNHLLAIELTLTN